MLAIGFKAVLLRQRQIQRKVGGACFPSMMIKKEITYQKFHFIDNTIRMCLFPAKLRSGNYLSVSCSIFHYIHIL